LATRIEADKRRRDKVACGAAESSLLAWVVEGVPGWEVVLEVGLVDGLVGVVLEVGLGVAEEVGLVDGLVEVVLGVVPRSSGVQSPSGSEQPSVKE